MIVLLQLSRTESMRNFQMTYRKQLSCSLTVQYVPWNTSMDDIVEWVQPTFCHRNSFPGVTFIDFDKENGYFNIGYQYKRYVLYTIYPLLKNTDYYCYH